MSAYFVHAYEFGAARGSDLRREAESVRRLDAARAASGRPASATRHLLGAAMVRAGQLVQGGGGDR